MEKKNLIVILLDALRKNHMSVYGYDRNTTPNLDEFSKEFIIFSRAYSTSNKTYPAVTSIFSGMYPPKSGIRHHGLKISPEEISQVEKIDLLPEILEREGYNNYKFDWMGKWFNRGFKKSETSLSLKESLMQYAAAATKIPSKNVYLTKLITKVYMNIRRVDAKPYKSANSKTDEFIKKLNENIIREPFFVYLHFWDTHTPYNYSKLIFKSDPPYIIQNEENKVLEILEELKIGNEIKSYINSHYGDFRIRDVINAYDSAICETDEQIRRIIKELDKSGLEENTILLILSDHGENLMDHGYLCTHDGLYENIINIPLMLKIPNYDLCGKNVDYLVSQVDILPTILNLLQIDYSPMVKFDGRNLLLPLKGKSQRIHEEVLAFDENIGEALITERYKYILSSDSEQLYNLHNDIEEKNNLSEEKTRLKNLFRERLKIKLLLMEKNKNKYYIPERKMSEYSAEEEEKEEIKKRLRSLGYF